MTSHHVGVVVIGRNEGERITRCLESVIREGWPVAYADSGSMDGSPDNARQLGALVVELAADRPFTAARGRNEGFRALHESEAQLQFVQMVDGDCEIHEGWIEEAAEYLRQHADVGIVCGRCRERYPDATVYNRLADLEWDAPTGEIRACGGIAMFRTEVFEQIGGYNEELIAGEDPEICMRVRRAGFRIVRLPSEMVLHDADMYLFSQWWLRRTRAGHAYAEVFHVQGKERDAKSAKLLSSTLLWGFALPAASLLLAWPTGGWGLALLLALPLQWLRIYRNQPASRDGRTRALFATACLLGKLPESLGVMHFALNRFVLRRRSPLIEYRAVEETPTQGESQ